MSELRDVNKKVEVDAQNFECANCGGVLKFDIERQVFACSACGDQADIETQSKVIKEYDFGRYHEMERQSQPFAGMAVASCQNCGLEVSFDETQVSTVCPMCGSTQIAGVKQKAGIPPEGIIPFKVDKNEARQKFHKWVKSRWFAPGDFKKKYGEGNLHGMYLPFWTYDANVLSTYTGSGGRNRTEKDKDGKERTVTDWYPVSGFVSQSFDDIQVCASEKEDNIRKIMPYNTIRNTMPYSPAYLSGYYAEIYKLKADKCFETAKSTMESTMHSLARSQVLAKYDEARIDRVNSTYTNVTYKHVLLPLWSSAYGYKGKTYKYLINGETGKMSGKRPWSAPKLAILIASIIAVISLLIVLISLSKTEEESYGKNTVDFIYSLDYGNGERGINGELKMENGEFTYSPQANGFI